MHLKIIIQDIDKKEPAEPQITEFTELRMESAVILEKGTSSGDTSIYFRAVDTKGKNYIIQLTGNMFRAVASAFNGAHVRFNSKPKKDAERKKCVKCGNFLDSHTQVAGPAGFREGDFTVCFFCGQLYRFNAELKTYPITADQEKELWKTHRDAMIAVTNLRQAIAGKRGMN